MYSICSCQIRLIFRSSSLLMPLKLLLTDMKCFCDLPCLLIILYMQHCCTFPVNHVLRMHHAMLGNCKTLKFTLLRIALVLSMSDG